MKIIDEGRILWVNILILRRPWKLKIEEEEEEEEEEDIEEKEEGVSFASKWKTRIRKGIVWVYNSYSNINEIIEKVWNIEAKDTFPPQNE